MSQDHARAGRRRAATALATLALVAGGGIATAAPAAADQDYWVPANEQIQLDGHGYGHGRGMSQYGARGAALSGVAWRDILAFYYPGTQLGSATGKIRVLLTDQRSSTLRVSPARRLTVRDLGDGTAWRLEPPTAGTSRWELRQTSTGRWAVMYLDGAGWHRWRVPGRGTLRGEGAFQAAAPLTLWQGSSGRQYRERLQTARPGGQLRVVNVLSLERYIRGVVPAEMPAGWELDALRAQSVAARTFAVRHRAANRARWFHVDDTIMYQVYGGVGSEAASTNRAVADTARTIVTYSGAPALTEFSSSSGGWTAGSSVPYQVVKQDPYDAPSGNPNASWAATLGAGALESRHPSIGDLQRITVTQRDGGGEWGGRILAARLVGSSGSVTVSGNDLRMDNGLRSTWFAPRDTPIIAAWRAMGGASSPVGSPTAAEWATAGGTGQQFSRGRIYHHARTGARETHGAVASLYVRTGGAAGRLGFPRTHVRPGAGGVTGASFQNFQRGRIYHHPELGARWMQGPILRAYNHKGAASGFHGFPVGNLRSGAGGNPDAYVQAFQRGRFYLHPATGPREVHGPIAGAYHRNGGPSGALGFPTSNVRTISDGLRSDFQGGRIVWRESTGRTRVTIY